MSKIDDHLIAKTSVVENTKKAIQTANKNTKDVPFEIMLVEIKQNFFANWESLIL